ncbi:hypothetical protein FKX85_20085 [Echinicola soli]|uniref:HTH cro/C1-type domain-containing protein n=1 Tax=Echinicola soli TaxID=2591634 RepID=A0A514CNB7_9BACT|nr:hypothetical protein [Echinicola soli]QDH81204.1 hypothetical protein FKX85_20085 [Echinicola soli]
MEKEEFDIIKIKLSLIVYNCLYSNKLLFRTDRDLAVHNESSLASELGVRKATVTDLLYCKSLPSTKTIFLILNAFKISFSDFAKMFDKINDKEAIDHIKNISHKMDVLKNL